MAVEIRRADFDRDHEVIRQIRLAVFVEEQGVPLEIEMDDRDAPCLHALAYLDGRPVGTGRLDIEERGKIGRVAVLQPFRRAGAGAALMTYLHRVATEQGLTSVWCHAQRRAVPFYERLGYRVTSEPFDEAGIEHVTMTMALG